MVMYVGCINTAHWGAESVRGLDETSIESTASGSGSDRDLDQRQNRELTDRESNHIDKILKAAESDPETSARLEEIAEIIREEKAEERRARRDRHELTEGKEALLNLLTGGDGEVRR